LEISWSTFILEIVNFLILVWILKRFLYQPVLNVISRRRADIDKSLAEAAALRSQAETIQEQYENRLAAWDEERKKARETLQGELDRERQRLMAELETSLSAERKKSQVLEQHRIVEQRRRDEELALAQAAKFASRLLQRLAAPELEAQLVELTLKDLATLLPERRTALRSAYAGREESVTITSAYPLATAQREALQQALGQLLETDNLACTFVESTTLIAGLLISVGPWVLRANLRDELQFFTESSHAAS
jgi:F-type H+-transporting ATPase subunit b